MKSVTSTVPIPTYGGEDDLEVFMEWLHTGCEELYFHWNYGRSMVKGLPILIAYFPQKYVGEYFVYTTSLFYFKYAYFILNTFQDVFQHIFAQTILNDLCVNISVSWCSTKQQTYFLGAY